MCCDGVVGVHDEPVSVQGAGLPQLGGNEEAGRGDELEGALAHLGAGEQAIQQVDCQGEHPLLTPLLLTHLQHRQRGRAGHLEDSHLEAHSI